MTPSDPVGLPEPAQPADPAPSLGAALRAAREAAGLTVEQVCETTRIRSGVVTDLEADRVASSGGAVYARGHVRALAHAIGVDPAPLVDRLERMTGEAPPALDPVLPLAPRRGAYSPGALHVPIPAPPERTSPRWLTAGVVAALVLAVLFGVGSVLNEGADSRDGLLTGAPVAEVVPSPTPAAPEVSPAPAPPPSGAQLALTIDGGASWISVRSPTQTLFEGEVPAGWTETFTDPEQLRVRVGNAGAVIVVCAGTELGPAGAPGKVLTFTCSNGGLSAA